MLIKPLGSLFVLFLCLNLTTDGLITFSIHQLKIKLPPLKLKLNKSFIKKWTNTELPYGDYEKNNLDRGPLPKEWDVDYFVDYVKDNTNGDGEIIKDSDLDKIMNFTGKYNTSLWLALENGSGLNGDKGRNPKVALI